MLLDSVMAASASSATVRLPPTAPPRERVLVLALVEREGAAVEHGGEGAGHRHVRVQVELTAHGPAVRRDHERQLHRRGGVVRGLRLVRVAQATGEVTEPHTRPRRGPPSRARWSTTARCRRDPGPRRALAP